jgi:hypothetical protein
MKTGLLLAVLGAMSASAVVAGDSIMLRNEQTGAEYGPVDVVNGAEVKIGDATFVVKVNGQTAAQEALEEKLKAIMIANLDFHEVPIEQAVAILRGHGEKVGRDKSRVNILATFPKATADAQPLVTMELRNVSLYDAIRYCCEAAECRMRIDDNCVVVTP